MKDGKRVILYLILGIVLIVCTSCRKTDETKLKKVESYESSEGSLNTQKIERKEENKDEYKDEYIEKEVDKVEEKAEDAEDLEQREEVGVSLKEERVPVKVKGIYISGPKAGSSGMDDLIALVEETQLNAMVIDVKNDAGEITYKMNSDTVKQIGASKNYISDMPKLIETLKGKGIYLIARIVSFKDPLLAEKKPELALKKEDGSIFRDKKGLAWVNPYKKEVWDYLLEVSKEAVNLGFDEIQYDYIRFSTDSGMKEVVFSEDLDRTKEEVITEFVKYMNENLTNLGVYISADVYGVVISSEMDQKIVGQDYKEMAENLDYICPMIYPSHYSNGSFGVDYPDLDPYTIVKEALSQSVVVLEDTKAATVRPWLQDFTATWLSNHKKYAKEEIQTQIKAVEDAGYEEWILWNGSNRYTRLD